MRERVARSRTLVARGRKPAVVARVMQVSRQTIYRTPKVLRPRQAANGFAPGIRAIVAR